MPDFPDPDYYTFADIGRAYADGIRHGGGLGCLLALLAILTLAIVISALEG